MSYIAASSSILWPLYTPLKLLKNRDAFCRQDTVNLYNIFSRSCSLKKHNSFLYLLSFPSLIESQTKVKQYKGFLLATRTTYPNTLCKDMLEQLIMLRGQLAMDLFKWSQIKPVCYIQPGMPE